MECCAANIGHGLHVTEKNKHPDELFVITKKRQDKILGDYLINSPSRRETHPLMQRGWRQGMTLRANKARGPGRKGGLAALE